MKKAELVRNIARESGLTQKDAEQFLTGFIQTVEKALRENERVQLTGLGVFETVRKDPKEVWNPMTRERIEVEPYYIPKFRFCTGLRTEIRNQKTEK